MSLAGRITGVGRALGGRLVTNNDFEKEMETTDEWVVERTGIKQRYFVAEGEDCVTLAAGASKAARSRVSGCAKARRQAWSAGRENVSRSLRAGPWIAFQRASP